MTVGDAVCSFWASPDRTTAGQPLLDFREVKEGAWAAAHDVRSNMIGTLTASVPTLPGQRWSPPKKRPRWFVSASGHQWVLASVSSGLVLLASIALFGASFQGTNAGPVSLPKSLGDINVNHSGQIPGAGLLGSGGFC